MTIEITGYERPWRLASATHLTAMDIHGTLHFEPVARGTRMRWRWELEPHGALAMMRPVVGCLGRRQEHAIWANLKRLLEERGTPPPG